MRRTSLALALVVLLGSAPPLRQACAAGAGDPSSSGDAATEPKLSARAAILMDVQSGQVLYARDADVQREPASLTKIMTALLACEAGDLDRTVVVSKRAAETGEASAHLEAGDELSLRDLLVAALLPSANDASVAIAEAAAGSESAFVEQMNGRAKGLGLGRTHFENPNGLPAPGHLSSARDLATMAREALRHDEFGRIVALERASFSYRRPKVKGLQTREVLSTNRLLRHEHPEYWPCADGVKTGYTRAAGRCLCATASENGWQLLAVVLGCEDCWADGRSLLSWGFEHYRREQVVAASATSVDVHVVDGRAPLARAVAKSSIDLIVPLDRPTPVPRLSEAYAEAPVAQGDEVGELVVCRMDGTQVSATLLAAEDVPRSFAARLGDHMGALVLSVVALALIGAVLVNGAVAKAAGARRRRVAEKVRRDRQGRACHREPQCGSASGAEGGPDSRSGAA